MTRLSVRRLLAAVFAVLLLSGWTSCQPPTSGDDQMGQPSTTGLLSMLQGEGWHYVGDTDEPAFASGWSNAGGGTSATAFRYREPGLVDIYVGVTVGTGTSPFTLPEGYRPSSDTLASGSGYSFGGASDSIALGVTTAGAVELILPAGSTVAVFTGSFWTEPPVVVP